MVKIAFLVQNFTLKFTKEVYFLLGHPVVRYGYESPACYGYLVSVSIQILDIAIAIGNRISNQYRY